MRVEFFSVPKGKNIKLLTFFFIILLSDFMEQFSNPSEQLINKFLKQKDVVIKNGLNERQTHKEDKFDDDEAVKLLVEYALLTNLFETRIYLLSEKSKNCFKIRVRIKELKERITKRKIADDDIKFIQHEINNMIDASSEIKQKNKTKETITCPPPIIKEKKNKNTPKNIFFFFFSLL